METPIRVLVAEDVPADAELEVRELERAGLRVLGRVAETEEDFRRALREFAPDVILSDFSMPGFDGMAALAISNEARPEVPFIFVSGTLGEEHAVRALKSGAVDYVLKHNLIRLPSAVERAVREARVRDAREWGATAPGSAGSITCRIWASPPRQSATRQRASATAPTCWRAASSVMPIRSPSRSALARA